MRANGVLFSVVAVAGLCVPSSARADSPMVAEPVDPSALRPVKIDAYVYINAATGEITTTPAGSVSRQGDLIWQNDDIDGACYWAYSIDHKTRNTTATGQVRFGGTLMNWGDIPAQSQVNGLETVITYDFLDMGCELPDNIGFRLGFVERYDSAVAPGGPVSGPGGAGPAVEVASFTIPDLKALGAPCTPTFGTIVYIAIDLEGSGQEFTLGDVASGLGGDLDGNGLPDFGYSFRFLQTAPQKINAGVVLVRPASLGGAGTATGVPDKFSWFNNRAGHGVQYADYAGDIRLGAGAPCSLSPPNPYSVAYLNLYGGPSGPSTCERVDFTADQVVDFLDYLEFLNRFDALDLSADLNDDGVIDFGDWLQFYNWFYDCTP